MENEKRSVKKATLIGPPPMPKKDAAVPSKKPANRIASGFAT